MMLRERMAPCQSREAVVTVASYHNGVMDGCLQHPRLDGPKQIESLSQLMLLLDHLLDMENCPNRPLPLISADGDTGMSIAVFSIQILFREHYTWQGRLIWHARRQEYVFHSAMELIQLMDEILAE